MVVVQFVRVSLPRKPNEATGNKDLGKLLLTVCLVPKITNAINEYFESRCRWMFYVLSESSASGPQLSSKVYLISSVDASSVILHKK